MSNNDATFSKRIRKAVQTSVSMHSSNRSRKLLLHNDPATPQSISRYTLLFLCYIFTCLQIFFVTTWMLERKHQIAKARAAEVVSTAFGAEITVE